MGVDLALGLLPVVMGGKPQSYNGFGGGWLDGTLSAASLPVSADRAIWSPAMGSDLFDVGAGTFASGTYSWAAQGSNTIANVGNELQITYVDNAVGALEYLRNASDLSADLTVNALYLLRHSAYINSGSFDIRLYHGSGYYPDVLGITATTLTPYLRTFRALSAAGTLVHLNGMGAGEVVYLDDLSIQPITLSDTARLKRMYYTSYVEAGVALSSTTQAGVCFWKDSANWIEARIDNRVGAAGRQCELWKCVAGTRTQVATGAITYSADTLLRLAANATFTGFTVHYGGAEIIAEQTINDFAADVSSGRFDSAWYVGMRNLYNSGTIADGFTAFSVQRVNP
jgi:hypothetical protein